MQFAGCLEIIKNFVLPFPSVIESSINRDSDRAISLHWNYSITTSITFDMYLMLPLHTIETDRAQFSQILQTKSHKTHYIMNRTNTFVS